jgi:amino-acid N-acetyltransferase
MIIRKAKINDAVNIQNIVNYYADKDKMLPRSLNEIYENVRDFWVCEDNGSIVGCIALHVTWEDLAEIKSLAVKEEYTKRGIGRDLMNQCTEDAKKLGVKKVFALSYVPEYFKKFGFKEVAKEKLPHKIWNECIKCPKFPNCGEVALLYNIKNGN